jgi:hypothetical protein
VGAFKFRGAFNRLSRIAPGDRPRGVVAFSSGNHAQGVALAARLLGTVNSVVFGGLATFGGMGLTHWRFPELWHLRKVGQEPTK